MKEAVEPQDAVEKLLKICREKGDRGDWKKLASRRDGVGLGEQESHVCLVGETWSVFQISTSTICLVRFLWEVSEPSMLQRHLITTDLQRRSSGLSIEVAAGDFFSLPLTRINTPPWKDVRHLAPERKKTKCIEVDAAYQATRTRNGNLSATFALAVSLICTQDSTTTRDLLYVPFIPRKPG